MATYKFFRWLAAGALATVGVACSSSVGQQVLLPNHAAANSAVWPVPLAFAPAKATTKHLYVIVTTATRFVAEYSIQNGIPAAKPDRVVRGLFAPLALTLDATGHLYVLDLKTIKEFAPGATGHARPIREIDVSNFLNNDALAVDARGYIYVGQGGRIYVYPPNAHGHAKPLAIIKPVGYPNGVTIDATGDLNVLGDTSEMDPNLQYQMHMSVYTPAPGPKRVREFCTYESTNEGLDYGVAVDGPRRLLTGHTYFVNSIPFGEIDVYAADATTCPTKRLEKITTSNPSLLEPVYVAVDRPYLYVCDVQQGDGGVIFTLRTTARRQTPLSTLSVANGEPHNVFGIALGP